MLSRLIEAADDLALPPAVLTFDPPPREFFARESAPPRLSSLRAKIEHFRAQRRRAYLRGAFRSAASLSLSPERFIDDVLVRQARRPLAAGRRGLPLRQGQGRRSRDAAARRADLQRRGDAHRGGRRRARVVDGRTRRAGGGRSRARPRAARPAVRDLRSRRAWREARPQPRLSDREHPAQAQAAARRRLRGARPRPWQHRRAPAWRASACVRPCRTSGMPVLEVFIFDFDDTIYGRRVGVEFVHKLRDEERYSDLDALTSQIRTRRRAGPRLFRVSRAPQSTDVSPTRFRKNRTSACPTIRKSTTRRR